MAMWGNSHPLKWNNSWSSEGNCKKQDLQKQFNGINGKGLLHPQPTQHWKKIRKSKLKSNVISWARHNILPSQPNASLPWKKICKTKLKSYSSPANPTATLPWWREGSQRRRWWFWWTRWSTWRRENFFWPLGLHQVFHLSVFFVLGFSWLQPASHW